MRRMFRWVRSTKKRKVTAGVLSTFLVAGAAYGYYATQIQDASTTLTYPNALGPNGNAATSFAIDANPSVVPSGLQPGPAGCKGTSGAGSLTQLGNNCGQFNTTLDATQTSVNGNLISVTLDGIDTPQNCPAGSVVVIWPSGAVTNGTDANATYTFPNPVPFTAGSSGTEMWPNTEPGVITVSGQPLVEFIDSGQPDQSPCANGTIALHLTAHAVAR